MSNHFEHSRLVWQPRDPNLTAVEIFRRAINQRHSLNLQTYHDLHKYSVEDYSFWLDLWDFLGIVSSIPPKQILTKGIAPELPVWFPDARLNYAENLLRRTDDGIACTASGESGHVVDYTFRQLREMVRAMAASMKTCGLQVGDRVAAIVTNSIEAVVICLATASCGAICSLTACDMGTQGILDRYRQIKPKFVFAETEVLYADKVIDLIPKITDVIGDLRAHGVQTAVLLPSRVTRKDVALEGTLTMSQFLALDDDRNLYFEQLPFSQPLFILYSSGTSGPPKCIVHSAGGVLLQTKKDQRLALDLKPDETFFQYTTTGWMMFTFMLTVLSFGSRVILYDGSPFHPDVQTFLKFIHDQRVAVFSTSPRFLSEVQGRGINPLEVASFESLRCLGVTGAVLTAPVFLWAQSAFGERIQLMSMSGGTDICSGFVGGTPALPVHLGEIQAKCLGMKVEVFDPEGKNIEHTGEPGELVCTRPHPSLPVLFWGDTPDGKKLRDTYFSTYPGIWRQGDFIVINPVTKGILILGRSDGVLNPSGVRFGSGEIYAVMEQFSSSIDDSLCIGQRRPQDRDERVLLFVKMRPGHDLSQALVDKIRNAIRKALSARHVPSFIFAIEDIPYTVNGKKIEIAVKQIVSGSNLKPSGTVANPESLALYTKFRDVEKFAGVKARL